MRNPKKSFIVAVVILSILLPIASFIYKRSTTRSALLPEPIKAQTVQAKIQAIEQTIETIGNLKAENDVYLSSGTAGRIEKIIKPGGAFVEKGQILLTIQPKSELRAPFSGFLNDWQVSEGEFVNVGKALVELINPEILSIYYRVPEIYAHKVKVGQAIYLSNQAFPKQTFHGVVKFVAPIIDKKSYTMIIRAEVNNPKQQLLPGMSVMVQHTIHTIPDALVIPESTVVRTMEGYEVFVIIENKVVKQKIEIGARQNGRVQITKGLSQGQEVLLAHTVVLQEGSAVTTEKWEGDW